MSTHVTSFLIHRASGQIELSPDLKSLAVQIVREGINVFATHSRELKHAIELDKGSKAIPLPVCFIHDGLTLLTGSPVGKVHLWDTDRGDHLQTLRHGEILTA